MVSETDQLLFKYNGNYNNVRLILILLYNNEWKSYNKDTVEKRVKHFEWCTFQKKIFFFYFNDDRKMNTETKTSFFVF